MRILLLSTQRGQSPERLADWTSQLPLGDGDAVSVISAHYPRGPLPIAHHIVLGAGALAHGRHAPVAPGSVTWREGALSEAARINARDSDPGVAADRDADPMDADPMADGAESGPKPRSITHALRWRTRRVQLAVRRARQEQPALRTVDAQLSRLGSSTKVNRVVNKLTPGGLGKEFALKARRSPLTNKLFAQADLVVALDTNTHLAAWLLARKHPRPKVVSTLAAGKQFIDSSRG